ncbi:MAG: hypothetical protein OEY23_09040 [Acidimicrobiia bacterium]|nr:hypothetical protein [Acidimicrobiia bacterium]
MSVRSSEPLSAPARRRARGRRLGLVVAGLALVASACGGSPGESGSDEGDRPAAAETASPPTFAARSADERHASTSSGPATGVGSGSSNGSGPSNGTGRTATGGSAAGTSGGTANGGTANGGSPSSGRIDPATGRTTNAVPPTGQVIVTRNPARPADEAPTGTSIPLDPSERAAPAVPAIPVEWTRLGEVLAALDTGSFSTHLHVESPAGVSDLWSNGTYQRSSGRSHTSMQRQPTVSLPALALQRIADPAQQTLLLPADPAFGEHAGRWVTMTPDQALPALGGAPLAPDASAYFELLRAETTVSAVGSEVIGDVATTRLRATISVDAALQAAPADRRVKLERALALQGTSVTPITEAVVVIDVWVDSDGLPRQLRFDLVAGGAVASVEAAFAAFNEAVALPLPPAEAVNLGGALG